MDFRKWHDKYSTDCRLKYPSLATQKNYIAQVGKLLFRTILIKLLFRMILNKVFLSINALFYVK